MNSVEEYRSLASFIGKSLGRIYDVFFCEHNGSEFLVPKDVFNPKAYVSLISECIEEEKTELTKFSEIESDRISRVSVKVFRNEKDEVLGALIISLKCNPLFRITNFADDLLNIDALDNEPEYPLTFEGIKQYISDFGIRGAKPSAYEKAEIINELYELGMFNIKGAVQKVADELKMSTKSVYRYLSKVKEMRE